MQRDWDEFFVASVIAASKENLFQSQIAIHISVLSGTDLEYLK